MSRLLDIEGMAWRMVVCHKHAVSARLHFLVPDTGVVLPRPLPSLCVFAEAVQDPQVQSHPATALRMLRERLDLPALELMRDYSAAMETPQGIVPIYLAAAMSLDLFAPPPGTRWIDLTQSIGMPWLDRELLRRAYEVLLG